MPLWLLAAALAASAFAQDPGADAPLAPPEEEQAAAPHEAPSEPGPADSAPAEPDSGSAPQVAEEAPAEEPAGEDDYYSADELERDPSLARRPSMKPARAMPASKKNVVIDPNAGKPAKPVAKSKKGRPAAKKVAKAPAPAEPAKKPKAEVASTGPAVSPVPLTPVVPYNP